MKSLVLGILLLEVVSGLTIFEAFLRLISGQPALKQLKDFPRCGRPVQIASGQIPRGPGGGGRRAYGPPQRDVEALLSYSSQTRQQCTTPESCTVMTANTTSDKTALDVFKNTYFNNSDIPSKKQPAWPNHTNTSKENHH